jgi:hypothetical protein
MATGVGFYGASPGNHSNPSATFAVDLHDTATLELITFASKLSKEIHPAVRAAQGRLIGLSVFLWKFILYGAFVWACRALNGSKRWFPARAVPRPHAGSTPTAQNG